MPNWTKQQEQAIRARNHTILVSAAAGSGKTAVLVGADRLACPRRRVDESDAHRHVHEGGGSGNAPALGKANQPRGYQP